MTAITLPEGHTWHGFPETDNECAMRGWTEALVELGCYSLHISHAPEADLDGTFLAFCHDTQERIRINGWMVDSYSVIGEGETV